MELANENFEKHEFKDEYGILIENINLDKEAIARSYYPFFLIRRLLYSVIITLLYDYPKIQLILIMSILIIPVFLLQI